MARHKPGNRRRVWVVVLGDFGRSPRMQYHTQSLCKAVSFGSGGDSAQQCTEVSIVMIEHSLSLSQGFDVRVIAYPGSPPIPSLLEAQQQGSLTLHLIGALYVSSSLIDDDQMRILRLMQANASEGTSTLHLLGAGLHGCTAFPQ